MTYSEGAVCPAFSGIAVLYRAPARIAAGRASGSRCRDAENRGHPGENRVGQRGPFSSSNTPAEGESQTHSRKIVCLKPTEIQLFFPSESITCQESLAVGVCYPEAR